MSNPQQRENSKLQFLKKVIQENVGWKINEINMKADHELEHHILLRLEF